MAAIVSRSARLSGAGVASDTNARPFRGQIQRAGLIRRVVHRRRHSPAEPDPARGNGRPLRSGCGPAGSGDFRVVLPGGGGCVLFTDRGAGGPAEHRSRSPFQRAVPGRARSASHGATVRIAACVLDSQPAAVDGPASGLDRLGAAGLVLGLDQVMIGNLEPLAVRLAWTGVAAVAASPGPAPVTYFWGSGRHLG